MCKVLRLQKEPREMVSLPLCRIFKLCRHCKERPAKRPRQLCWKCFNSPGVREQYPSLSKFGRRGIGNVYRKGREPDAPTSAAPGSAERVAVLEERAKRGESLWHPNDNLPIPFSLVDIDAAVPFRLTEESADRSAA